MKTAITEKDGVRIGAAAELAGTTARTIRYYEEIGLLPSSDSRAGGAHRLYSEEDIERVREILRLKNLLGLSLDELKGVIEDEDARQHLRARYFDNATVVEKNEILSALQAIVERQLELLERRRSALDELEGELTARRRKIMRRLREIA